LPELNISKSPERNTLSDLDAREAIARCAQGGLYLQRPKLIFVENALGVAAD
jgi:hypothetical protein